MHLEEVLFLGLRADKRSDIGRSLSRRNEPALRMSSEPDNIFQPVGQPSGRAKHSEFINGYSRVLEHL